MKRVKMGDICLDPARKRYFQKVFVRFFDLGVTEELPLPRGVRELTQKAFAKNIFQLA